ncbi:MAG: sialidase family protein [Kiritimatiellae bacterium]|nr:sialidase family protein [Kiritimatiellia bacterium]MDD5519727.1 sialidase family protein [Kiritimatiellia bacterium]
MAISSESIQRTKQSILLMIGLLLVSLTFAENEPSNLLRTWQGIPGLERTAKGRVFVSWFSGGRQEPAVENTVYLCYSDDQGKTFTDPQPIAGPRNGARAFDPTLWIDPEGKLWYIFNRGNRDTAEHGVCARICDNPEATPSVWSPEFHIGYDEVPFSFRMNKPTVLSTGEWIMPVTHAAEPIHDWHAGSKHLHGVGISTDKGKTWKLHGALKAPSWALENMIVELRDGRLWMLIRTGAGFLWQSYSHDKGRTWTEPGASTITNPGSRFFIRRLSSGNLLLVNHYKFKGRSHITASLSTDEGRTWNEGLLLDERSNISYPDGVQDTNGLIWIVYDHDRQGTGEILLARFREEDVAAGRNVSGAVRLKQAVNQLPRPMTSGQLHLKLLPADWNPKAAADQVLSRLVKVTAPQVKGAHDAEMVMVKNRAYIVAEVNDERAGERAEWSFIYAAMSIVNLQTLAVEKIIPFARGGQVFSNEILPPGTCFGQRILQKDARTVRCYFASEKPDKRQSQTWFIDFDIERMTFENSIHKAKLKTAAGIFDMQPKYFYEDAVKQGFKRPARDFGLYPFDSFKYFDNRLYVGLNNFPIGQNALANVNDAFDTFEIIGHFNEPAELKLTESAVNRLPDGTWMAICRQEGGNGNYLFTTSKDGRSWTRGEHRDFVPNGTNSKPTFDKFRNIYYLGWQEATKINGVSRSVFNIDISFDGMNWERKYRFETDKSFQYPAFREYHGTVWLCVTQGDSSAERKERIMFGRLE